MRVSFSRRGQCQLSEADLQRVWALAAGEWWEHVDAGPRRNLDRGWVAVHGDLIE